MEKESEENEEEVEEKETEEKTKEKNNKKDLTEKLRENPWVVSTVVLGIICIIFIITSLNSGITGNIVSEKQAGENLLSFAKTQGVNFQITEIKDNFNLYEVLGSIDGEKLSIYVTKDGKNLVQGLTPLAISQENVQEQGQYSNEDIEKIKSFVNCLSTKGLKIYGANWCGWTKRLVVETLGGFDVTTLIYVECTENQELCSKEEVTGYPTIKINGKVYSGARTLEGLAEATNCDIPSISKQQTNQDSEASCN